MSKVTVCYTLSAVGRKTAFLSDLPALRDQVESVDLDMIKSYPGLIPFVHVNEFGLVNLDLTRVPSVGRIEYGYHHEAPLKGEKIAPKLVNSGLNSLWTDLELDSPLSGYALLAFFESKYAACAAQRSDLNAQFEREQALYLAKVEQAKLTHQAALIEAQAKQAQIEADKQAAQAKQNQSMLAWMRHYGSDLLNKSFDHGLNYKPLLLAEYCARVLPPSFEFDADQAISVLKADSEITPTQALIDALEYVQDAMQDLCFTDRLIRICTVLKDDQEQEAIEVRAELFGCLVYLYYQSKGMLSAQINPA